MSDGVTKSVCLTLLIIEGLMVVRRVVRVVAMSCGRLKEWF